MRNDIVFDPDEAAFARQALLAWFQAGARVFPWRYDPDPYHVLMAEMMLRRTQARQVVAVYKEFLRKYPDIASLDQAPEEEVATVLYPLGLAWRAKNFKLLAHEMMERHHGEIPRDRATLLELTGVGPYVADAVRCFAFHETAVIVDTNTVRVAARYFGFAYHAESRRRKPVIQIIATLVDEANADSSNYALLDFAATICRAQKPDHARCPLATHCRYYHEIQTKQQDAPTETSVSL